MLKVLLDARKINDGGIGTYIKNLVSVFESGLECKLSIIVPEIQTNIKAEVEQIVDRSESYSLDEYLFFSSRIKSDRYDLYHSPHFTLPYFLKCPAIVTVHDTIHISAPEKWYYPFIAKRLIVSALKRASRVIVVSEASKQELKRHFGKLNYLKDKIEVVPNAIRNDFLKSIENQTTVQVDFADGFLLSVISQNKPHKGLLDLLSAYAELKHEDQHLPELILAGYGVRDFVKKNTELAQSYQKSGVVFLGQVSQAQLNSLYIKAMALVMASKIEGFGLTVLEAKALGCPVLSRPLPSVLEMLSDCDLICKDMSQQALKAALRHAKAYFSKTAPRNINSEICEKYSLQNLAEKTLRLYRKALDK